MHPYEIDKHRSVEQGLENGVSVSKTFGTASWAFRDIVMIPRFVWESTGLCSFEDSSMLREVLNLRCVSTLEASKI